MSVFIVISQTARVMAIWSQKQVTRQILLTVSVIAYSALLMQRENKIDKYYDRSRENKSKPEPGDSER
jgi:hypothetical protein